MKRDDVEIIEKTAAFEGYFRVDRYRLRHRLFEGGMSGEIQREVFERGHAVGVLPFDPVRQEIVLIEQFRIGAYAAGYEPWLIEIVAGIIDAGEAAEDVARRELLEEAGLTADELWPMIRYLVSPGGTSESVQLFLARVDARKAGGIHGLDHENEDIRVSVVPLDDALGLLDDHKIDNSLTVVGLQWLALHRAEVCARWAGGQSAAAP